MNDLLNEVSITVNMEVSVLWTTAETFIQGWTVTFLRVGVDFANQYAVRTLNLRLAVGAESEMSEKIFQGLWQKFCSYVSLSYLLAVATESCHFFLAFNFLVYGCTTEPGLCL